MRQDHSLREGRSRVTACTRTWPCVWPPLLRHTETQVGRGSLGKAKTDPRTLDAGVEEREQRGAGRGQLGLEGSFDAALSVAAGRS